MNMPDSDFVFVGYLVQERYVSGWWKRESYHLASIENTAHPTLEKRQWSRVDGVLNATEFLLTPPDMSKFDGWILCGYSIERSAIARVRDVILDPQKGAMPGPLRYEYALNLKRTSDGLNFLGYEVVDAKMDRLSILNNCGYTVEQVEANAGPLNRFSLFSTAHDARKFQQYIQTETEDHHVDDGHADGIIFEIWGS
jgi:hypothetical protein